MKIIDAHVHCSPEISSGELLFFLEKTNTDGAVIQAVGHSKLDSLVPIALEMKVLARDMGKADFYVFAAPLRYLYFEGEENLGKKQAEYISRMIEMGADGVKLLEGKPQMRKNLPIPDFDAPCWEPFWCHLEENRIPIMWHVNDPETFWANEKSEWLVKQGWAYDNSYINNEEQYRQVLEVMRRHPKLKVIFAHFFFMSAQLERLSEIMDRYPNVYVDLTPGIEMYENFSANALLTRQFFEKYCDRIVYGTDIGGRCILTNEGCPFNEKECLRRPQIVRYFLEGKEKMEICSDGDFLIDRKPFIMKPLGLGKSNLEKIYHENIERFIKLI